MKKLLLFTLGVITLIMLNGCNSVFPENKSVATSAEKSQGKNCNDVTQKSPAVSSTKTVKTYKIIGD